MRKTLIGTSVAAAVVAGVVACSAGEEFQSQPEPGPGNVNEEPLEKDTEDPEYGETLTLREGDSHEVVNDAYGESYTITLDEVRYLSEISSREYVPDDGPSDVLTAYYGTGFFVVIEMTYTNDDARHREFSQVFDAYADSDDWLKDNSYERVVTSSEGWGTFTAEDVGVENLLDEVSIPSDSSVEAAEVVPVPEKSGYLYSFDGEFRLELPEE